MEFRVMQKGRRESGRKNRSVSEDARGKRKEEKDVSGEAQKKGKEGQEWMC